MPLAPGMEATDDPLRKWETAVDRAIREAQEQGAFDRLPGHGKPLDLAENPYAGEWAVAFHVLDNAGIAPLWMELNREIVARREDLATRLEAARADRAAWAAEMATSGAEPAHEDRPSRWVRLLRWLRIEPAAPAAPIVTADDVDAWSVRREGVRRRYLERAAEVDETIRFHNAALPAPLGHLEQLRILPAQAAADFDAAWPSPVLPAEV